MVSLSAKEDNFIDDSTENQPYRFVNQTHDSAEALDDDDGSHLDRRDLHSEMFFGHEQGECWIWWFPWRKQVRWKVFKKDSFFGAVLYGILVKLSGDLETSRGKIMDVLGEDISNKFMKEKGFLQLDDSFDSFFDKCHLVNDLLETKGLFFRVYERCDGLSYVIKKE